MAQASDKEREIHTLILSKDELAFAKFCDAYYELIFNKVEAFNRLIANEDETLIADIVTDVFLNYFKNPERYDPEKQTLEKFLVMDAEGDLKNAWAKRKRQNKKFAKSVELDNENGNSIINDNELFTPYDNLIHKEAAEELDNKLKELFKDETDIIIAHLMLSGERSSAEYARVLRIEHLDKDNQRLEVKKQKDRIDKVIQRKLRGNTKHE